MISFVFVILCEETEEWNPGIWPSDVTWPSHMVIPGVNWVYNSWAQPACLQNNHTYLQ